MLRAQLFKEGNALRYIENYVRVGKTCVFCPQMLTNYAKNNGMVEYILISINLNEYVIRTVQDLEGNSLIVAFLLSPHCF